MVSPENPWPRTDAPTYGLKWVKIKTLWPKKSFLSGNAIPMFSTAYHLEDARAGIKSEMWLTEEEFVFERLKGNI